MAVLQGVGTQAVVTEFLIRNADAVFSDPVHSGRADGSAGQLNHV